MIRHSSGVRRRFLRISALFILCSTLALASAFADSLRGRVVDPDSRPVADARVIVVRGAVVVTTATSGADGRFGPIDLPAGEYEIFVAAPGLRSTPKPVSIAKGAALDVTLPMTLSAVEESVVVSAAQVDTPLSHVTDSVTVIDRADLEVRHTDTVADALRLVPGFGVVATGDRGAITSIFPRGGNSDYTLVLVDGIPQNAFGGGFDAAHLDTADIDHIEVVRGPESALFGDGAIGGIVQVVTRQGGPLRGEAAFEGGAQAFRRSTASATGSSGAWRWGASFDRLSTDGDTSTRATIRRQVANDDYDRIVGSGSFGWSDSPSRSVRVDVRGDRDVRGYPGPYGSDPLHLYSGLDLVSRGRNTSKEVGASGVFGRTFPGRHRFQFTWADLKSAFTSPFGPSSDETRRVTGRYQFDLELPGLGLSSGGELLQERVDNTFITGQTFQPVPITRFDSGLFIEARPSVGGRGFLTMGARLERIQRSALDANPSTFGPRPAFGDDVVWSINPKVSAAWFVRPPDSTGWTKIRAGAGTGIKPPTGFEIAFTDNPNLKPERNRSVDAGIEQALAGSAVVADATWFYNRYDDLIVSVGSSYTGASRYRTDNIANARATGLETGLRWRTRRGLAARVAWTWLNTSVLGIDGAPSQAPAPYAVGGALVRRPRQQGSAEITWTGRDASAFFTVGGRGPMADLEPNYASTVVTNPGYAIVSIGASLTLARHLEVFGRVINALDHSYEEVYGFPSLGRSASVGIRVAASR